MVGKDNKNILFSVRSLALLLEHGVASHISLNRNSRRAEKRLSRFSDISDYTGLRPDFGIVGNDQMPGYPDLSGYNAVLPDFG